MFFFFVFLVVFLFFLVLSTGNILVWWSVFVGMDIIFILMSKNLKNYTVILNYFVIQEMLGLLFLLMNFMLLQFVVVMFKVGMAPFHFWVFNIINGLSGWMMMWFLTFQKLPFLGVMMMIFCQEVFFMVLLGFFVCYFQIFFLSGFKWILTLCSTESLNWVLLGCYFSSLNFLVMFIFYLVMTVFMIPFMSSFSGELHYDWLVLMVYMNVPLGVAFFVKFFVFLNFFGGLNLLLILLLFLMFMSFMVVLLWMMSKSMKGFMYFNYSFVFWLVLLIFCSVLVW